MKASELMIGNWVNVPHNGNATHYGRITAILPSGAVEVDLNGDTVLCSSGSVTPIPLTSEILEKSVRGYRRGSGAFTHFIYELNEEYFIRAGVGGIDLCMHYDDSEHAAHDDIYLVELGYVHTLQQTIQLFGIEKEIVL